MKLVNLLSSVILEDAKRKNKKLVMEISQKALEKLIDKFKNEDNSLDEKDIAAKIEDFEKYKNQLPSDKRDLFQLTYAELSDILSNKESKKTSKDLFTQIKDNSAKAGERVNDSTLKRSIRQLMDVSDEVPKEKLNVNKITYLTLIEFLNKNYLKLIISLMKKKFPNIGTDIIEFYASNYYENYADIPADTKPLKNLTFDEIEHVVDAIIASKTDLSVGDKKSKYNVDMVFPAEGEPDIPNLEIYAPKGKIDCIKLQNGRSWCISREGGSNLYYNYRLGQERTIYFVIDNDKPFSDVDYAIVVLVDPQGQKAMADGSNNNRYAGTTNMPWSEIVSKVNKLKDLEHLFVSKPLTPEEETLLRKYWNKTISDDNLIEALGSEQEVEYYLEIGSFNYGDGLTDVQFSNLTNDLQKKYIARGFELSGGMVRSLDTPTLTFYINRRKEGLERKTISQLTSGDIQLLNSPPLKALKAEKKASYFAEISFKNSNSDTVSLTYPEETVSKYIDLYGFDDILSSIPKTVEHFGFINTNKDNPIYLTFPEKFKELQELRSITLNNCINEIPKVFSELKNLKFLSIDNCAQLSVLPDFLADLSLQAMAVTNCSPNLVIEPKLKARIGFDDGMIFGSFD